MHSYHRPRRIQYALGVCFVAFGGCIRAQGPLPNQTQVQQCTSPLTPAPCPLLATVMSTCTPDDSVPLELPDVASEPFGVYPAPSANNTAVEKCQCTDVVYNLQAACAACQVGDDTAHSHWLSRDQWFRGCIADSDESQIAVLPPKMSSGDVVPWMTQIYPQTFSLSDALVVASGGSLPTIPTTSETAPAASANPSSTVLGSAASSNTHTSGSTTNTTGIIVGAVIGALALLALLSLGIFCLRRRQKQRTAPSAEFMKYSQVNAGSAREPLRTHSRANTAEEEMHLSQGQGVGGGGYKRQSAIRLDSVGTAEEGGDMEMTEGGPNPPPFTPGLFKDPIFEKGVALNLAAASAASGGGGGGGGVGSGVYGGSPITYSPGTPSTQAHIATQFSERHGLIHGRQDTL